MYLYMIKITVDPSLQDIVAKGGEPLRDLCRKEVDLFDKHLRHFGSNPNNKSGEYKEGLGKYTRWTLEGYLYQKLRGALDNPSLEDPDKLPG